MGCPTSSERTISTLITPSISLASIRRSLIAFSIPAAEKPCRRRFAANPSSLTMLQYFSTMRSIVNIYAVTILLFGRCPLRLYFVLTGTLIRCNAGSALYPQISRDVFSKLPRQADGRTLRDGISTNFFRQCKTSVIMPRIHEKSQEPRGTGNPLTL